MARVKRGVTARRRHKKVLKQAKGYYNFRRSIFRVAKQAVTKAGQYAYRDRKVKKRVFRALWITRINAQARVNAITYSQLIAGLKKACIEITVVYWRIWLCMTRMRSQQLSPKPRPLWLDVVRSRHR